MYIEAIAMKIPSLLILGNVNHYRVHRIVHEWQGKGGHCHVIDPHTIVFEELAGQLHIIAPERLTEKWDAVLLFSHHGVAEYVRECSLRDKTHVFFHNIIDRSVVDLSYMHIQHRLLTEGLPVPKTYYQSPHNTNQSEIPLAFPYIVKRLNSSAKQGVRLVHSAAELQTAWKEIASGNEFVAMREYVPQNLEWRVNVLNGKALSVVERFGKDEAFLSAFRDGATRLARTLDEVPDVVSLAERAAKATGLVFCGIDIIQATATGKHYIVDVNKNPNYKTTEEVTGINIAQHVVEYMMGVVTKD